MKTKTICLTLLLLSTLPAHAEAPAPGAAPTDPKFQYSPEDFGVGRRHTGNTWCSRQIDALLEETRTCFNTRPAAECEALQKKNSKKAGNYIKSPRCIK